jgi:hypothetical protein
VADRCQLGCTICYAYRQSCSPCQGDVRQIVARVSHLFFGHTCPFHALLVFQQDVADRLVEHLGEDDLTTRELDVLRLIRDGYRNKQIADQLAIAETTVNFHIKNLVPVWLENLMTLSFRRFRAAKWSRTTHSISAQIPTVCGERWSDYLNGLDSRWAN